MAVTIGTDGNYENPLAETQLIEIVGYRHVKN